MSQGPPTKATATEAMDGVRRARGIPRAAELSAAARAERRHDLMVFLCYVTATVVFGALGGALVAALLAGGR